MVIRDKVVIKIKLSSGSNYIEPSDCINADCDCGSDEEIKRPMPKHN